MKKKTWIGLCAGILVAAAVVLGVMKLSGGGSAGSSEAVPVIPVSSLGDGASMTTNRFNGVVETQKKKNVSLDTSRTVKEVLVTEGVHVEEGDALFTYDIQKTELEISQKELEKEKLASSIQNLNEQIAQLNEELNKGNLSSADRMTMNAQIMEHQTSIAQAQYDTKAADAEISRLRAEINNSTVRSPMSGTIREVGDPSNVMDEQSAFIKIVADGDFRIKGTVSEQNIGSIYEGASMLVRSRVDSEQTWMGTITSIETGGESEEQNSMMMDTGSSERATSYSFYVSLDSMEGLMLGQHVTLEMAMGEEADITADGSLIPMGYVGYDEEGNAYVMAVAAPGEKLEKRPVEIGNIFYEQGTVEILSGITDTDYVAWPENQDCVEGAPTSASEFAEMQ